MPEQEGNVLLILIVIIAFVSLGAGAYFLGTKANISQTTINTGTPLSTSIPSITPSASPEIITTSPFPSNKADPTYTEQDGVVWGDVHEIVVLVNLYYAQTNKLPKSIEEAKSLPDYSYFQIKNNQFTGKPYTYTPKADNTGFTVSGIQSDGTEYIQDISFN